GPGGQGGGRGEGLASRGWIRGGRQRRSRRPADEDLTRDVEEIGRHGVDAGTTDVGPRNAEHSRGASDNRMRDRRLADVSGRRSRRERIPLEERPNDCVGEGKREVTGGRGGET